MQLQLIASAMPRKPKPIDLETILALRDRVSDERDHIDELHNRISHTYKMFGL